MCALHISRRHVLAGLAVGGGYGLGLGTLPALDWLRRRRVEARVRAVLPVPPVALPVRFGDAVVRLVEGGAIDPVKFAANSRRSGGVPDWVAALFERPSDSPLMLSMETAPHLLNLLWPMGLATRMTLNGQSPLAGTGDEFASTGGWTLGRRSGGALFNSIETVALDGEQEEQVRTLATATFRPCCDNDAWFQDCNHGSAMLGFYQLAVAQRVPTARILRAAVHLNAAWYPEQYLVMASFIEEVRGGDWAEADPALTLGRAFASATGWRRNVRAPLAREGLDPAPRTQGGAGCAV